MMVSTMIVSLHNDSGSVVKHLPANAGDMDSIPGSERSPGEGYGNPFQHPCLDNLMDSMKRKNKKKKKKD